MEKDKKIQMVINIVTVINIIVIIILGYHLIVKSKYNVRYIESIAKKSMKYYNYMIEIESEELQTKEKYHTKIFQKENARREDIISENVTRWNANDVHIFEDRTENRRVYSDWKTEQEILYNEIDWWKYVNNENFKYIGNEKYNDLNCIVLYYEDANIEYHSGENIWVSYKIWVDEETGSILKEEQYSEGKLIEVTKYNIQFNCVTDKEIDLPDLKNFEKIKGNN